MRRRSKTLPSRPTGLRPEDAPLGSLESRAAARAWLRENQKRYQVIFACNDANPTPLYLENSTCVRQTWPDGSLCEIIYLDGRLEDLTEEQLQAFIDRFPINATRLHSEKGQSPCCSEPLDSSIRNRFSDISKIEGDVGA